MTASQHACRCTAAGNDVLNCWVVCVNVHHNKCKHTKCRLHREYVLQQDASTMDNTTSSRERERKNWNGPLQVLCLCMATPVWRKSWNGRLALLRGVKILTELSSHRLCCFTLT
eukprot:3103022-Amphidinium_carterae.1